MTPGALPLQKGKPASLARDPKAMQAFCTVPTLVHPDPECSFVVEVDASAIGVDVVLSPHQVTSPEEWGHWLAGAV